MKTNDGKLVDDFDDACHNCGVSRAEGYRLMAAGHFDTFLVGRRRKATRKAQQKLVDYLQRQSAKAA